MNTHTTRKDTPNSPGAEAIKNERYRQITVEGWSADHDDEQWDGEIAGAAASYAHLAARQEGSGLYEAEATSPPSQDWRWPAKWWKPSPDPVRNLVKAGALIAAEIDRLLRERNRKDAIVGRSVEPMEDKQ